MDKAKLPVERLHAALIECNSFKAAVLSVVRLLPVDSLRSQVVSLFVAAMLDHYSSITHLFSEERYDFATSAFALIRPIIDSAFRGVWIANFAKDEEIASSLTATGYKVFEKVKPNNVFDLMKDKFAINDDGIRENISGDWQAVHGFVHTGTHQLKHRLEAIRSKTYPYKWAIAALAMSSRYVMVGSVYVAYPQNKDVALSIAAAYRHLADHIEIERSDDNPKPHMVN
jgi:hypothetical protein